MGLDRELTQGTGLLASPVKRDLNGYRDSNWMPTTYEMRRDRDVKSMLAEPKRS